MGDIRNHFAPVKPRPSATANTGGISAALNFAELSTQVKEATPGKTGSIVQVKDLVNKASLGA
jgi:hypothetical protein